MATDEPEPDLITATPLGRTVDRYHAGRATEAHRRHRAQAQAMPMMTLRVVMGIVTITTDACDCRVSARRHEIGWTHPSAFRSEQDHDR